MCSICEQNNKDLELSMSDEEKLLAENISLKAEINNAKFWADEFAHGDPDPDMVCIVNKMWAVISESRVEIIRLNRLIQTLRFSSDLLTIKNDQKTE